MIATRRLGIMVVGTGMPRGAAPVTSLLPCSVGLDINLRAL